MRKLVGLLALGLVIVSCKKDQTIPPGKYDNGILVLNEGLFQTKQCIRFIL